MLAYLEYSLWPIVSLREWFDCQIIKIGVENVSLNPLKNRSLQALNMVLVSEWLIVKNDQNTRM